MKLSFGLLNVMLLIFALTGTANAATISTLGTDDGSVFGRDGHINNTWEYLAVQNGVGHSGSKGDIAVLEFDISSIDISLAQSSFLNLYLNNIGSAAEADLYLEHYINDADGIVATDDYSLSTETVMIIPNIMSYIYNNGLSGEIISFDISNYFNNDIASGYSYSSYQLMLSDHATSNSSIFFASAEHASSPAPYVEYSAVPITSAIWLLGTGLIGIAGFRRKIK